ncbi:MAG TPA: pyridoxal phosphate-dependent aminotransferase [Bryobacteraceae bacterium]|nr:pyridoxal phosphate-dependent aminotransferase [Bryobacteraceae bacterium]
MNPSMHATLDLAERVSRISESSTMKVAADADRLRREGVDVVDFGAGEPDFPTPDNIKKAAIAALDANFTKYTPTGGTVELKQAICARHREDYGTDYAPAECIASVGGKHAIFNLMQILIGDGDEVIIPVPYWVTYKDVVNYAGGKCVFVETNEDQGFTFTAESIAPHITSKTKLLIINSPSNPSGAVLSREEFERIYHLAAKRGVQVMTDECYCRFLYDSQPFSIASMPGAKEHVIVAGSLSKTYAMTGWRIGFALAPKPLVDAMMKLQSHTTSNPTSIAQKGAIEALRGPQESIGIMLAEYQRRRDFVVKRLRAIVGVKIAEPRGAFYAYPNISVGFRNGISSAMQFSERLLAEAHVAVVPGEAFGTKEHVRISYATSMTELERGLDRIDKFIRER